MLGRKSGGMGGRNEKKNAKKKKEKKEEASENLRGKDVFWWRGYSRKCYPLQ